jgi:type I restriction enzyme R subunit
VVQLCNPINLLDAAERNRVLEEQGKSTEAKADMIASATRHVIEAEMAKDPAFYKKFSQLLEDVLAALAAHRIQALEALKRVKDIATKVATHTEDDTPRQLVGKDMARRFFGCVREDVSQYSAGAQDPAARIALAIAERIKQHKIRDWRDNQDALNLMRGEIDDIFFEECKQSGITIPLETQDKLIDACIEIARANED